MSDQKHNYTGYLIVNLRYKKDFCRWNKMFARALEARKWSKRKNHKYTQYRNDNMMQLFCAETIVCVCCDGNGTRNFIVDTRVIIQYTNYRTPE